jgi:hypothetical protein
MMAICRAFFIQFVSAVGTRLFWRKPVSFYAVCMNWAIFWSFFCFDAGGRQPIVYKDGGWHVRLESFYSPFSTFGSRKGAPLFPFLTFNPSNPLLTKMFPNLSRS